MGRFRCTGGNPSRRRSVVSFLLAPMFLAACGGDASDLDVDTEDIDADAPVTITEDEYDSFDEPSDGVLSTDQVTAYLRTSLLQFDYVREQSERLRENVQGMDERAESGGALNQLRNLVDAGRTLYQTADLIGGSYIRSSRALGYNPAEMEWVRERFVEIAGHMAMAPIYAQAAQSAQELRDQAEEMRRGASAGEPGMSEQADALTAMADDIESGSDLEIPPTLERNVEVLRESRPSVTDDMWTAIGFAAGASGLLALSGWGDPEDQEAQQRLDELRQLYQAALDNRSTELPDGLR